MSSDSRQSASNEESQSDNKKLDEAASSEFTYTNSNYKTDFLDRLCSLYRSKKLTDVELICGENNEIIECHKVVLASFSIYFDAMFASNLIESQTNRVSLSHFDHASLSQLVDYAYTGSLTLNVNNVQNIFTIASILQVKQVVDVCCEFMESQLDLTNVIEICAFAKRHMCHQLVQKSFEFIARYIVDIIKSEAGKTDLLRLDDVDLMVELLASNDLDIESEDIVLELVFEWIEYDIDSRLNQLGRFLNESVRLGLIEPTKLVDIIERHQTLYDKCDIECQNKLQRFIKSEDPLALSSSSLDLKRSGMLKAEQCFLLIGGNCELDDGSYVNCFNPFNGDKYFLSKDFLDSSKLCSNRGFFHIENPGACVTCDNKIFVAGGVHVYHKYKIYNYNSRNSKSATLANPDDKDSLNDGKLFNFVTILSKPSNLQGQEILSKDLFEYDSKKNTWKKRNSMLFAKSNFSLCADSSGKRLYSFGGVSVSQVPLDIVEYFDIGENQWQYLCSMPAPFVAGCVVSHPTEQIFYVLGGRNGLDLGRHDSCYQFNADTNEWTELCKMSVGRFNFGACLIDQKIFVFGGQRYDESEENYFTREALDTVEVYDLKTKKWQAGLKMPAPLYNTGVCVWVDEQRSNSNQQQLKKWIYLCGTTECKYSKTKLFGFMFTSVFKLELNENEENEMIKWIVVEHDVSEIKTYYRCIAARVGTKRLYKFNTDIHIRE